MTLDDKTRDDLVSKYGRGNLFVIRDGGWGCDLVFRTPTTINWEMYVRQANAADVDEVAAQKQLCRSSLIWPCTEDGAPRRDAFSEALEVRPGLTTLVSNSLTELAGARGQKVEIEKL